MSTVTNETKKTAKDSTHEARKTANTKERSKELEPKLKLINIEATTEDISNKTESFFFEKVIKIDKPMVGWIKQQIKRT